MIGFANFIPDFDRSDPDPRHEVDVFLTYDEYVAMTESMDRVRSEGDFVATLTRHVGPDFVEVARKHFFRIVVVPASRAGKDRWSLLA